MFSLFVLQKAGQKTWPSEHFEDIFVSAFPMVLLELDGYPCRTPEEVAGHAYTLRMIERFAAFFGLVRIEDKIVAPFTHETSVTPLPLLWDVVQFHV